jgi:TonB family protein
VQPPDAEKIPEEEQPKESAVPPPPAETVEKTEKPSRLKGAASDQEFEGPVVFDVEWSEQNAYIRQMLPLVKENIRYSRSEAPPEKVRSVISFSLKNDGTVNEISVFISSGFDTLDRIAMKALASASPFPPLPAEAGVADALKGKIRITFNPARH